MSTKEQYWKYSLIVIILFMGVIIFRQITPFLGGLLGALTIYILVRTQMNHLKQTSGHQSGSTDIGRTHSASSGVYQGKDGI